MFDQNDRQLISIFIMFLLLYLHVKSILNFINLIILYSCVNQVRG